ncbi:MAG: hypothetical protein JXB00_06555 [Bacteroidales bacterium]|nr:hypothetical protein [Bacteroidales bacterium]
MKIRFLFIFLILNLILAGSRCQTPLPDEYNLVWNKQSRNSSESMPCGGGDIGLNVWVENGDILFYISRSGTFDENNGFLKPGRVRIKMNPNPFSGAVFTQELVLEDGNIKITGSDHSTNASALIWVDIYNPVIHVEISTSSPVDVEVTYENWRYRDLQLRKTESFANSFKWSPFDSLKTLRDEVLFRADNLLFYHRNRKQTVFDVTVEQQSLDKVKEQLFNPLNNLTFGGLMTAKNMKPDGTVTGKYLDTEFKGWKLKSRNASKLHHIRIFLHTAKTDTFEEWEDGLERLIKHYLKTEKPAYSKTTAWWREYWKRSFIIIQPGHSDPNSPEWQAGRNYQLFRYMLGCNAFGEYPTKFNGGLFTYDPRFTDSTRSFTPDYRNWGGGTFTAQNQRLVYFPMLKSGDFDMMKPQFDFYSRILKNAEMRSKVYWGHEGACFTEQMENFGLPNCTEYGWNRPDWFDKGLEYNAWLEYQWDTALEFCLMILETERYAGKDITEYLPLIESCLTFFNEHYQYLAKRRGIKAFDGNGKLILYPGTACETYKMAYNPVSTVAALNKILSRVIELPENYLDAQAREKWQLMLKRIPPLSFREINGHKTIAPARLWERVNNTETPQLYPVFPWGIYGIGKPDLDIALNTWNHDPDAIKFRSHVGWKQDNIFAARLGLTKEASDLTLLKLKDSGRRFPAFWGPGFDWVPDHNWGGSGMIGLQEMLMQVYDKKIYLFPAWPETWDVHFKLHAPYNTTVEGIFRDGKLENLIVIPEERKNDIINMFE